MIPASTGHDASSHSADQATTQTVSVGPLTAGDGAAVDVDLQEEEVSIHFILNNHTHLDCTFCKEGIMGNGSIYAMIFVLCIIV